MRHRYPSRHETDRLIEKIEGGSATTADLSRARVILKRAGITSDRNAAPVQTKEETEACGEN